MKILVDCLFFMMRCRHFWLKLICIVAVDYQTPMNCHSFFNFIMHTHGEETQVCNVIVMYVSVTYLMYLKYFLFPRKYTDSGDANFVMSSFPNPLFEHFSSLGEVDEDFVDKISE